MNASRSIRPFAGLSLITLVPLVGAAAPALAQVNAFGLDHTPVGETTLELTSDGLVVTDIDWHDMSGVHVQLSDPSVGGVGNWECSLSGFPTWSEWGRYRDPILPHQKTSYVALRTFAPSGGLPNTLITVASMNTDDDIDALTPIIEFPGLDATSFDVQYFNQGTLVHEIAGLAPGTPLGKVCCETGSSFGHGFGKQHVASFWAWSYTMRWTPGQMETADGLSFPEIDRAVVYPNGITVSVGQPTALEVVTDAISTFTITDETYDFSSPCYTDCDNDGSLTIDDFICFQTLFALGSPYVDCDSNGVLNVDDFICFQTFFAISC